MNKHQDLPNDFYIIEKILKCRKNKKINNTEFLIKWRGYPSSQNTWEPKINLLNCKGLLNTFLKKNKKSISNEPENQELKASSEKIKKKLIEIIPIDVEKNENDDINKKRKNPFIQEEKSNIFEKKFEILDERGSCKNGDIPLKIVNYWIKNDVEFFFMVEWERRKNGFKPLNEIISSLELKYFDSFIIIDFYEDQIKKNYK